MEISPKGIESNVDALVGADTKPENCASALEELERMKEWSTCTPQVATT